MASIVVAGSVICLPRWRIIRPGLPDLCFDGNLLLYRGARVAWALLIAEDGAPTPFDTSNAYIAVGNGSTVPDPSQTDLMGTSTERRAVSATYPRHTSVNGEPATTIVYRAAFPDGVAEFHWQEVGLANSSSGPTLFNRRVRDIGDKPAGVPDPGWVVDLTFIIQPAPAAS